MVVVVEGSRHLSLLAFAVSYTGWSWCILTARAGLCAVAPILELQVPAAAAWAAAAGSALRFPALAAAVITFTVWNTMLLPILCLFILPPHARSKFLRFNFGMRSAAQHSKACTRKKKSGIQQSAPQPTHPPGQASL